ncbi:MAG: HepT-like ribonuclease domain-containing protein [Dehalococcoidia bacterium]
MYLRHIAESIDLVGEYVGGANQSLFLNDHRTQDAVLRRLETLADAAGHISDTLKTRHPDVPWRQISDFRNVLAHGYTDIRLDRVWEAITADLPVLRAVVQEELQRLSPL